MNTGNAGMSALRSRWALMRPRERALVASAAALVAVAVVWWVAIAPALATLRGAEAQHRVLDAQLQHMLALQSQAQALQAQPKQSRDEALRLLETTVKQKLGTSARITIAGDRVTLTLAGTPADALSQWLTQARVAARALPTEARIVRNAAGAWDGSVVLALPPQ